MHQGFPDPESAPSQTRQFLRGGRQWPAFSPCTDPGFSLFGPALSFRSHLSVSLGVAMFPEHGVTSAALLRAADAALYRAKEGGRDRVVLASAETGNAP